MPTGWIGARQRGSWSWAFVALAAGIYDDQSKLVAGLSISAPADRIDENWVPKLRATAAEISAALGCPKIPVPAATPR